MRHSGKACTNAAFVLSVSASLLYLLVSHVHLHAHVSSRKCHIHQNILMEKEANLCTLMDSTTNLTVLCNVNSTDLLNEVCAEGLKHGLCLIYL